MVVAHTVLGLAMLLFGRKLFWLFVGAAGFLAGSRFGAIAFAGHSPWLVPVIAVTCGLAGVALQYTDSQFAIGPMIDERN